MSTAPLLLNTMHCSTCGVERRFRLYDARLKCEVCRDSLVEQLQRNPLGGRDLSPESPRANEAGPASEREVLPSDRRSIEAAAPHGSTSGQLEKVGTARRSAETGPLKGLLSSDDVATKAGIEPVVAASRGGDGDDVGSSSDPRAAVGAALLPEADPVPTGRPQDRILSDVFGEPVGGYGSRA